jgi:hypothetical protein
MSEALKSYLERFHDAAWVVGTPHEVLEPVAKAYWQSYWDTMIADTNKLSDSK